MNVMAFPIYQHTKKDVYKLISKKTEHITEITVWTFLNGIFEIVCLFLQSYFTNG